MHLVTLHCEIYDLIFGIFAIECATTLRAARLAHELANDLIKHFDSLVLAFPLPVLCLEE